MDIDTTPKSVGTAAGPIPSPFAATAAASSTGTEHNKKMPISSIKSESVLESVLKQTLPTANKTTEHESHTSATNL